MPLMPSYRVTELSVAEDLFWQTQCVRRRPVPLFDCASVFLVGARVHGIVDVDALRRSIADLVTRHEVLRSVVWETVGRPVRVVASVLDHERLLEVCDTDAADGPVMARLEHQLKVPIDVATGPWFRAVLVRRSRTEHVLAFLVQHLAFDGWSKQILAQELKALYAAHASGCVPALKPLPISHEGFVSWQNAQIRNQRAADASRQMVTRLTGAPGYCHAHGQSAAVERIVLIDAHQVAALQRVSNSLKVTLAVVVFAIFVAVLQRATGRDELLIGMPIMDRRRREFFALIGLFVDILAVRLQGLADEPLAAIVSRVRQPLAQAYVDHRALPYGRFVQWVQESGIDVPDYAYIFSFHNPVPAAEFELPGLRTDDIGLTAGPMDVRADASLQVGAVGPQLLCAWYARSGGPLGPQLDACVATFVEIVASLDDAVDLGSRG